jgi:hypothetical protein
MPVQEDTVAGSQLMFPDNNNGRMTKAEREAEQRRRARRDAIKGEVQEAALKGQGAMALAGHLMGGVRDLDEVRKDLSGNDPLLTVALGRIEARALRQVDAIQAELFEEKWGL